MLLSLSVGGFALAAVRLHTGRTWRYRVAGTSLIIAVLVVLADVAAGSRSSWDLSENHRNSFSSADEIALSNIHAPLRVTVYLAAEDPRLTDFERSILNKLRRTLPLLEVQYAAGSRSGLFEGTEDHYGEIWYELDGRKGMSRSTTEPIVLEQLYELAEISPPQTRGR